MKKHWRSLSQNFIMSLLIVNLLLVAIALPLEAFSSHSQIKTLASNWSGDIMISDNDSKGSAGPDIAIHGNNLHVVWYDIKNSPPGSCQIFYRKSENDGISWKEEKQITTVSTFANNPQIATEESNLHVVFESPVNYADEVYYKRSLDNGDNWSQDVLLSEEDGYMSYQQAIAVGNSNVHVVWKETKDFGGSVGFGEIYYERSINNGDNWDDGLGNANAVRRLTDDNLNSCLPLVAANGTTVHVFWSQESDTGYYTPYYSRSENNGKDWTIGTNITPHGSFDRWSDAVAIDGDKIYLVGREDKWVSGVPYYSIWFVKSEDSGNNWDPVIKLVDQEVTGRACSSPVIAISNTTLFVVWQESQNSGTELYYTYSTNEGNFWVTPIRLTYAEGGSGFANVAFANNVLHIVWQDTRYNDTPEVFYKRSPDFASNISLTSKPNMLTADGESASVITATITNKTGSPIQGLNVNFNIEAGSGTLLQPNNTTDANGTAATTFVAGTVAGNIIINVSCDGIWNKTTITLLPSNIAEVKIIPEGTLNLYVNNTQQFTVVAYDKYGNINTSWQPYWHVEGSIGTINEIGFFTATKKGSGAVNCSDNVTGVYNISIINVLNSKPTIELIANQTAYEGQTFILQINASDPDNDILTFSDNSTLFNMNSTSGLVSFTPTYDSTGTYYINITVTDGEDFAWREFKLIIININRKPVVEQIINQTAYESQLFTLQVNATDPDIDTLTFSDNSTLFNINSTTGLISFTPSYDSVGEYLINISVSDGTDLIWQTFKLTIINMNRKPILGAINNQTAYEGQVFLLRVNASDLDNNTITFSDNSTLFNINSTMGLISFTPSYDSAGIYSINITVTDGEAIVSRTFKLTVLNVNRKPILDQIDNQTGYEGQLFSLQINATDLDGDALIFSDNSTLFDINSATGLISFTPSYNSSGIYLINVSVTDGEFIVWQFFNLTIVNVNRNPTAIILSPSNNAEFTINDNIFFDATGSAYLDNNNLIYTWASSVDGNIGSTASFTRKLSQATHTITLTVDDDNGGTDIKQITITVKKPSEPSGGFIPGFETVTLLASVCLLAVIIILLRRRKT